ncbi:MAG: hypothetical protein RBT56_04485 [Ignavibacteriaceae bacterium]|jgi:hypothetical protein|nr:hypothetical protein [Ignavibacteriaceae bacterium]
MEEIIIVILIIVIAILIYNNRNKKPTVEEKMEKLKSLWGKINTNPEDQRMELVKNIMDKMIVDGTDQDVIPGGFGEFGLSISNPIPVNTIVGSKTYLDNLQTIDGKKIQYERSGSTRTVNIKGLIDVYNIFVENKKIALLYIAPYNKKNSGKTPKGFKFLNSTNSEIRSVKNESQNQQMVSRRLAIEIVKLIELQLKERPFSSLNLSNVERLRAETSLAILNLSYFIFFINYYSASNKETAKLIIDNMYEEYFSIFKQKHIYQSIILSEIIVDEEEQYNTILIASEWGIKYDKYVNTLLHNLFPFLYQYRIPIYLKIISESIQKAENNIAFPFLSITHLFMDQFSLNKNSNFSSEFEFNINISTLNKAKQIVEQYL